MMTKESLPDFLTDDELRNLIPRVKNNDLAARAEIITSSLKLIVNVAMKFKSPIFHFDGLTQIGTIGLIRCIEKFEAEPSEFYKYAAEKVEEEIKLFLKKQIHQ